MFQFEGSGMTRYVKELKPQSIRHLAAMVALYRPADGAHPRVSCSQGRAPSRYVPDPSLEDILEESYGIIVYQDQVLQIVQRVAEYSLGQADILRRAMGKKDPGHAQRAGALPGGIRRRGYAAGRPGAVGVHRAVRGVCVQQGARLLLRSWRTRRRT